MHSDLSGSEQRITHSQSGARGRQFGSERDELLNTILPATLAIEMPYHWLQTQHEGNEVFTTVITRERLRPVNWTLLNRPEADSRLEVREWNYTFRTAKDISDVLEVSTIVSEELHRM